MNRTRLTLASVGAFATIALASGCAAGGGAASLQVKPNMAAGDANGILAQDIVVVVDPETGAAQLTGTVVNTTDAADQLTSVSINSSATSASLPVSIDAKSALNLAGDKGTKFVAPRSGVKPGVDSTVNLTFATGGKLTLTAEVQANAGIYSAYQPSIGLSS